MHIFHVRALRVMITLGIERHANKRSKDIDLDNGNLKVISSSAQEKLPRFLWSEILYNSVCRFVIMFDVCLCIFKSSICLSVWLSVCLSVCLTIRPSVRPSVCRMPFIYKHKVSIRINIMNVFFPNISWKEKYMKISYILNNSYLLPPRPLLYPSFSDFS